MRILVLVFVPLCSGIFICCSCSPSTPPPHDVTFSKADSLTEQFLSYQDSLHKVWNVMISRDNQKIETMKNLLHEVMVTNPDKSEYLNSLEARLDQLTRIRYTQKSLSNADVIAEYDLASESVFRELLTTVQSTKEYSYNKTLQHLVRQIESTDAQVFVFRREYDSLVRLYNRFVDNNRESLLENDESLRIEKKPLFRVVSEQEQH